MAKGLGIKIKIDYPAANEIQAEFNRIIGNVNAEVKVKADTKSLNNIRDLIRDIAKNETITLKFDNKSAITQIREISTELNKIKKLANEKVQFGGMADAFKEVSKNAKDMGDATVKAKDDSRKAIQSKGDDLRDLSRIQKEIFQLESKQIGAGAKEYEVYQRRIEELKTTYNALSKEKRDTWKESDIGKSIQQIGEFNIKLREAKEEQKHIKSGMQEYTKLLNEEYKIRQQLDSASGTQAKALERQLQIVQQQQQEVYKKYDLEKQMSTAQKEAVTSLTQQHEVQRQINTAKKDSKQAAKEQKDTYRDMKKDLGEIHKIQNQIAELEAKKAAGIQSAKEEDTLNALRNQLAKRERIHSVMREKAEAEGRLSSEAGKSLDAMDRTHRATEDIRNSTIQKNIEIEKSKRAYEDVYASIKRVDDLNKQLSTAGREQASVIREQISAEVQKQNSIMSTLAAENKVNDARRQGIQKIQSQQREQTQLAQQTAQAAQMDTYQNITMIDNFNPRRVYSQARRMSNMVYKEVADLDRQLVQIEKVAQATEAETERFHNAIFDFSSEVGKSAVEYGSAVERWVIQGYELAEATESARHSMIGAFVGNTNEKDMVDYLSIPARTWRDEMGEAVYEVSDILNSMNEVANNNAITVDDLGSAYKKASQTALQSGMEFEQMTGLITGANDATRLGGAMIGTAMRNINMNFATVSAELTEDASRKAQFFRDINVPLLDTNGSLRNTYDIIENLQQVWGGLSEQQQTTAAFYAAEKRHAPILQAMVTNWDAVEKATGEAYTQTGLLNKEQGSAYREFEQQQDSIQYKQAQLKNSWTELMTTISGGRSGIGEVLDMMNRGLERVIELVERPGFGDALKTFLGVGTFLTASIAINKFATAFTGHMNGLLNTFGQVGHNGMVMANKLTNGGASVAGSWVNAKTGIGSMLGTLGSGIKTVTAFGLGMAKLVAIGWGINEVSKIMFDVDLLEGAYNWFGRVTGATTELQQNLDKVRESQERSMEEFYSSNFMSGSVSRMNDDLESLRERLSLDGITKEVEGELSAYSVVVGDTLSKIADENGLTLDQLIDLNPDIEDIDLIFPDQEVVISVDGKTTAKIEWQELDPEEFLELQREIDLMAEEYLPDEIAKTIGLQINSEEDIRFTFNKLEDAIKQQAAIDIAEAMESVDEIVNDAMKASNFSFDDVLTLSEGTRTIFDPLGAFKNEDGRGFSFWKEADTTLGDLVSKGYADELGNITDRGQVFINMMNEGDLEPDGMLKALKALDEMQDLDTSNISSFAKNTDEYKELVRMRDNAIEASATARRQILQDFEHVDVSLIAREFESADDFISSSFVGNLASIGTYTQIANVNFELLKNMLDEVGEAGDDLDGVVTRIPHSILRSLAEVIPELRGMPADLTSEAWDNVNLDDIGNKVIQQSEQWLDTMAMTFAKAGKLDEWVNFEKDMSDGVTGVLEVMNLLAQETGQTYEELAIQFGVSVEAMSRYGDDIFDVMIGYQGVLDELSQEYITKYKLETDQGTINMDVIDAIHTLPDLVTSKFELIGDDGIVNLGNIENMLGEINDPEMLNILARFGVLVDEDHTGNTSWDLSRLHELFGDNADSEFVQKFFAELDIDMSDIEIAETKLVDMDTFLANPVLKLEDDEFNARINSTRTIVDEYDGMPITLEALMDASGFDYESINLETRTAALNEIGIEFIAGMDLSQFEENELAVLVALGELDEELAIAGADLDPTEFEKTQIAVMHELGLIDASEAIPDIDANDDPLIQTLEKVRETLDRMIESMPDIPIEGDDSGFETMMSSLMNRNWGSITLGITGRITQGLTNTINGVTSRFNSVGVEDQQSSMGSMAINPQVGRSFSQSVTDAVSDSLSNTSYSATGGNPRYQRSDRVNSDIWRYWSSELYKGLPLDSSMSDVSRAIQEANDNYQKLIPLYQQQIRLIDRQIKHEGSMLNSQQSEMNHILAELRKMGFRTSGNQVTNLGHSKGMRDERAAEADDLLRQYRSLYETMEATRQTIASLNTDRINANTNIDSARDSIQEEKAQKELEKIEARMKRTEGLLTAISNDTSIFSTKLGLLDGGDFELRLGVTEEGINKSSQNVRDLTGEFNKLSRMNVEYGENAEQIQTRLESLRAEILSNADAILAYRRSMNDLQIDRMASDFAEFSSVVESNVGRVRNNIDLLRGGLTSGDTLSDSLIGLNFDRRSEIEKDHQERLELESHLNDVLDKFAKKNIDRTERVANAQLTIEQNKYRELLKLADDFSNGKVGSALVGSPDIGTTSVDTSKNSSHAKWQKEMVDIVSDYEGIYAEMVEKYNRAMTEASTATERELLNHKMIIEQLELQESIYQDMIKANERAISEANSLLENDDLTTEQRKAIESMIRDYEQSSIDAQNSIRDSIQERFDLEFQLLDKAVSQSQRYTNELQNMLNIAEAVGVSSEAIADIHTSMYDSKVNEYATALGVIEELQKKQSEFEPASYEWNIIEGKIDEIQSGLSDLTIDILNANQKVLDSQLDSIRKSNESNVLGMGLDEFNKTNDNWVDGIEKAYEIEKLMRDANSLENNVIDKRLELMDRQESVTRSELEYADMLIRAQQMREKLENIGQERTVQTLVRNGEGNWQWGYVSDQSEYDDTQDDLTELEIEMERFRREQQTSYVSDMNDLLNSVSSGEYSSIEELSDAIDSIENLYTPILGDELKRYDTEEILDAYRKYLENNQAIVDETEMGTGGSSEEVAKLSKAFADSFLDISEDLGKTIGTEIKKALREASIGGSDGQSSVTIQNQTLSFPNVKSADGLEEAILGLPGAVNQIVTGK